MPAQCRHIMRPSVWSCATLTLTVTLWLLSWKLAHQFLVTAAAGNAQTIFGVYIFSRVRNRCWTDRQTHGQMDGQVYNCIFYRTANSIFGKIGRSASGETTLQLIQSKCIPALLYGLEACPTNKSHLRSLDFVLHRFFMKLFRTSNVAIVRQCQELFGFQLPSTTLCKRVDKFVGRYYASDNLLCKICSKFV